MLSEGKYYCGRKYFYIIYMFKRTLGVQKMHPIKKSYLSPKNVQSNIQKKED